VVLDPLNNGQIYQPITPGTLPLGIAGNPLRFVAADDPETDFTLLPENGVAPATLVYTDPAVALPIVLLDGRRLTAVYQHKAMPASRVAAGPPIRERGGGATSQPIERKGS
jgi:hypothetical protein